MVKHNFADATTFGNNSIQSKTNMEYLANNQRVDDDPTAAERKKDHIELAFKSQVTKREIDDRFYYEPLLAAHPKGNEWGDFEFLGKTMRVPLWVSSMTGGTALAKTINHNLARACKDFGMGMGLGSCRSLLFDNATLSDFNVRPLMGDDLPLYANLGIAQLEQLIDKKELWRVDALVDKLQADGLIIHVNPMQEWLQPEGDRFEKSPLETIETFLNQSTIPVIVKEVGQGMGKKSLDALLRMPIQAVDFAANGGTNFARLELARSSEMHREIFGRLAQVGHSAEDMVNITNALIEEHSPRCPQVIISGGIQHFLDGYYLINKLKMPAIYGQASAFLKHARGGYDELFAYVNAQVEGLSLAKAFLKVR